MLTESATSTGLCSAAAISAASARRRNLRSAGDSEEQALGLLDHARRVGLRRFDTANTYGGGASEIILGKWLRVAGRVPSFRDAQIATKVGNPHGCPPGETPLSGTQIAWHLDESLRRLGVERIDLYYIHEFDRVTPLEETLEAMTRAVEAGKIASFGVSNASLPDVEAVRSLAGAEPRRLLRLCPERVQSARHGGCRGADPLLRRAWPSLHRLQPARRRLPHRQISLSARSRPPDSRLAHAPEACAGYLNENPSLRSSSSGDRPRRDSRRWRRPPCASSSTHAEWTA